MGTKGGKLTIRKSEIGKDIDDKSFLVEAAASSSLYQPINSSKKICLHAYFYKWC
jgi:hypothetical protein